MPLGGMKTSGHILNRCHAGLALACVTFPLWVNTRVCVPFCNEEAEEWVLTAFCAAETATGQPRCGGNVRAGLLHIHGGLVYKVSRQVPGLPSSSQNPDFVLVPLDLNSVSLEMDPDASVPLW